MRRVMQHPSGIKFRSEGSVEWPNDTFTRKRLKEGSVKLVEERQSEPEQRSQRRHQPQAGE
jgi:hypothetical protein